MLKNLLGLLLISCSTMAHNTDYPDEWWAAFPPDQAASWEILPQAAKEKDGDVILSKRTELGTFSNFAATPFEYRGKKYASVEGYWQMMKYPEGKDDPRWKLKWVLTREQVSQMTAFEAKAAGDVGSENMKKLGIDWVTFEGKQMKYKSAQKAEHYKLIYDAMMAKMNQNPKVKQLLLKTGDLKLRPDHTQDANVPPEWKYYEIWMQIRALLRSSEQTVSAGNHE